jgi:outer membrane protein assembly factor BamB
VITLLMALVAQDYVVLAEKDEFAAAGKRLVEHRKGALVTVSYDDLAAVEKELRTRKPRYVAVVTKPERIDTNFVRRVLMLSTRLDDDPFCDFAYGFITGRTPADALAFVERIIRAEKEGVPKRFVNAGVSSKMKSMAYDEESFGWKKRQLYWSENRSDPEVPAFVKAHVGELEKAGLLEITGNGDPERIWLFPGERNFDRAKQWPYDPKKVGQNPDGEMFFITADDIAKLDLYPAVVDIGTCHSGSLLRTFVANDIVSTFGRVEKCEVYDIPAAKSLGLTFLARGVTAYIAPVGPNHGFRCGVETRRMLETGAALGDVMKSCYDELVVASKGKLALAMHEPGGDADPDPEPMISGAANRVLYGDPAFKPFAKCAPPGFAVKDATVTVQGDFVWDSFDQFTRRPWRVWTVLDVAGPVKGVKAESTIRIVETRWLVEDGKRLHVAAYSDAKELRDGTAVTFTIEKGAADVPSLDGPKRLWQLDTKSPSYGSGAVADVNGDGKLEIVFGTYYNDEHLYCVSAADGSVLWKHKSDRGPFDASVAIADLDKDGKPEILAADSSSGRLVCLDGAGREKWAIQLPNSTDSPPAVADLDGDGTIEIVVGSMWRKGGAGDVTVYSAATQKAVWTRSVKGCVQSEPCLVDLDGDKVLDVIVTSWRGDNAVHAFSGKDGQDLWTFATMGDEDDAKEHMGMYHGVSAAPLTKGGPLRIAFATCSSKRGTLFVVDAKGALVWKKMLGEYLFAPTTIADLDGDGESEIVAVGQRTHVFSPDGKLKWKADLGSTRGPAIADVDGDGDRDLVLGARGRKAVALDGSTGRTLWSVDATAVEHRFEELDSAPLIADFDGDGTLDAFFVVGKGTSDKTRPENYGRAFALRLGKGSGSWTTFRGNLRRTGSVERVEW